jgi:lysophospholipase L1-like esterase
VQFDLAVCCVHTRSVTNTRKWGLRLGLLGAGFAMGVALLHQLDQAYLQHEQEIHSQPVFEPYGVKYAYRTPPEPGTIRGWVAGMAPPAKLPGVKRIIALGDSVTFGLGVHAHEAWPAALESQLDGVEVFNLGMCGWDIEQSVSLVTGALAAWEPDLIVWGNFPNDVLPSFLMWGAHDEHPVFVGTSVPEGVGTFSETLDLQLAKRYAMYRQWMAARMARAVKNGLTPAAKSGWYADQLARLRTWSTKTEVPVIVLTIPAHTQASPERCPEFIQAHDCEKQAQRYAVIQDAASRSGLTWVDGQRLYAGSGRPHFMLGPGEPPGPGGWPDDAEHPTAAGHRVLAAGLLDVVRSRL